MAQIKDGEGSLTLKGQEIKVTYCQLKHNDLQFYPENPRIYSIVCTETKQPSQKEIQKRLIELEHVRQLVQSIRQNGGLIDPLIVRRSDDYYVVLEGNSRLAAYRLLAKKDPIKWAKVKCCILSDDVTENQIFALLGEYHIVGKKDWAPFEQAGYLYRRQKNQSVSSDQMGKELGLSTKKVNHLISVYRFMVDKGEEDLQRWSYYDEYLKSQKVARERKKTPKLDDIIVKKVKSGEISKAIEMRDKVVKIVEAGGKTLKKFTETPNSLEISYERAVARGATNHTYQMLKRFRTHISDPDIQEDLLDMSDAHLKKCLFELKHINRRVSKLIKKFIPT
ncbi:ParB N-terminal domain-containing protein [Fibrobacterota bacterium]